MTLDTESPVLSNITAIGVTEAAIRWNTNEPTTGKVEIGLNENYGITVEDSNTSKYHQVLISGLIPETLYHYRIISSDIVSNITKSTDLSFLTVRIKGIFKNYEVTTSGEVIGRTGVTAIAGSCHLTTSGGVKCMGTNCHGELGIGKPFDCSLVSPGPEYINYSDIPLDVKGLSTGVKSIAAVSSFGTTHYAVTTSGGLKCWGPSRSGECGQVMLYAGEPIDVVGLTTNIASVATGFRTCALNVSGGVKCMGDNSEGQLGNGTFTSHDLYHIRDNTPVDVVGISSDIVAITSGDRHSCALTTSGGVKCWGSNDAGQLGDGTTTDRLIPVDVAGLSSGITAVAARDNDSTCALTISGGFKCWGGHSSLTPVDVIGLH